VRLLGIQLMQGYSSEARVFASLLSHRAGRYEPLVIHQHSKYDSESASRFETHSQAEIARIDAGWRKRACGASVPQKVEFLFQYVLAINKMIAIAQQFQPDVVYSCQQHWDCWAATYIARRLKIPQIIHLHYIIGPWLRRQPLERLLTCDQVVTVSNFIWQEAVHHGCDPGRVTAILNPAPILPPPPADARNSIRQELGIPSDAPVIGNVSRLDPGKSHVDIIDAFDTLARRRDDIRLVIVGDGMIENEIRKHAASKESANRILFTGRRSDVPSMLAAFDIFAHPSLKDPCPLAIMEASLAKLPIVAYADGGMPEIVQDGVTGLLAETGNVAQLTANIDTLLVQEECRHRLGVAGQAWIGSRFRPEKAGAELADTVERVARTSP